MKAMICKINWVSLTKTGLFLLIAAACFYAGHALADNDAGLGKIAGNITGSFEDIGKLLVAVAYIAGFGFVIAGIFKFKQHKDNPTQIPMGTPIAMVLIGVALIFMPTLVSSSKQTAFKGMNPVAGGFSGTGASQIK
jgi:intracellular multiplication protein IcmD